MKTLEPWRCPNCRRLLAMVALAAGSVVEIRCHGCKATSTLDLSSRAPQLRTDRPVALAT